MAAGASRWAVLRDEVERFVVRRAPSSDVDDLVQEVLAAVAHHGGAASSPTAYAVAVARRTVAEHHRRRAREHRRLARVAMEPNDASEEPESGAERALVAAIAGFLDEITPAYAEALRRVDVAGERQADVARALGIPLSTLRSRVQRGRAELRARIRRCCDVELDRRGRVLTCEPREAEKQCGCGEQASDEPARCAS